MTRTKKNQRKSPRKKRKSRRKSIRKSKRRKRRKSPRKKRKSKRRKRRKSHKFKMMGNGKKCATCITPYILPIIFSSLGGITCGSPGKCIGYEVGIAAGQCIGNYSSLSYWITAIGGKYIKAFITDHKELVNKIIIENFELILEILRGLNKNYNIKIPIIEILRGLNEQFNIKIPSTADECINCITYKSIIRNVMYGLLTLLIPFLRKQYIIWRENAIPIPQEMERIENAIPIPQEMERIENRLKIN